MRLEQAFDVAIIGYGPTGQALALALARAGHSVVVIERHRELYPLPRAVAYDDEIARFFDQLGVSEQLADKIEAPSTYQWRNAARELLLDIDWTGVGPSGWPRSVMFSQPALEAVLHHQVQRHASVRLYRGWAATEVRQTAEQVEIEARPVDPQTLGLAVNGAALRVRARYLVGSDGANSFVRNSIGSKLQDLGFSADWLVVDVQPKVPGTTLPHGAAQCWQLCDPARPTTVVSGGPGRRRWEFMALANETLEELNRADVAWRLLAPWGITPENAILERHAVYRFKGALADVWSSGRVMIAGDAAHLTPPFAGQGMCAGMRDAVALAWRLDLALRGTHSAALFESYGIERAHHAAYWIHFAIELGKVICVLDPAAAAQRDAGMMAAQADPSLAPPPPPPPRLGPGVIAPGQAHAGLLSVQGVVKRAGTSAANLFDRVLGRGFVLLARRFDPQAALSAGNAAFWHKIGGLSAQLAPAGTVQDSNGTYQQWFDSLGAEAVLMRPDFYLYGTASTPDEVNALVGLLADQLKQ
jgi:2-polyprenyl-6-methoxyphenol hydroxylase-like FAD-dependent oxidoreductase